MQENQSTDELDVICVPHGRFVIPRTVADLQAVLETADDDYTVAATSLKHCKRGTGHRSRIEEYLQANSDNPSMVLDGNTRYYAILYIRDIVWEDDVGVKTASTMEPNTISESQTVESRAGWLGRFLKRKVAAILT